MDEGKNSENIISRLLKITFPVKKYFSQENLI